MPDIRVPDTIAIGRAYSGINLPPWNPDTQEGRCGAISQTTCRECLRAVAEDTLQRLEHIGAAPETDRVEQEIRYLQWRRTAERPRTRLAYERELARRPGPDRART